MKVMREGDYLRKQSQDTAGFLMGLGTVIAILFAIAAMIGAAITMNGAVAHRTREIGTLRALGFSRAAILFSFVLEAVFLSLLGGIVGVALSMVMSLFTFPVMNFTTFSEIVIGFRATPQVITTALIFSVVMASAGCSPRSARRGCPPSKRCAGSGRAVLAPARSREVGVRARPASEDRAAAKQTVSGFVPAAWLEGK